MNTRARPLSPHLQVYRPQLTSILSIVHRGTGVMLAIGALLIAWWFWAAMSGADSYATIHGFLNSIFGKLLLIGWVFCNFYHLCNGIRHLGWDVGKGLEIEQTYLTGKLVVVVSIILTVIACLI